MEVQPLNTNTGTMYVLPTELLFWDSSIQYVEDRVLCTSHHISNPGGYSHTLPIRVCAAQRGRDFEAPGLERGIHFRRGF